MAWAVCVVLAALLFVITLRWVADTEPLDDLTRWKLGGKTVQERIENLMGRRHKRVDPDVEKLLQLAVDTLETVNIHELRISRLEQGGPGETWKEQG